MDFELAGKHKREVEQRRREAKRKLEQQKRDEEQRAAMEQEHKIREELRCRAAEEARAKAEEERRLNEGISYSAMLRPYPSVRTDDKLELPPSALAELERQGALERGTLLTFKVCLPSGPVINHVGAGSHAMRIGETHAGVAEFTAEEGSVGVPPRVALCLTKGAGLDTLAGIGQVGVRFFRLPRSAKSNVKLQPRGEGFHAGGVQHANIDLERVLQESLRGHTALTVGDWLPIRHDGYTYELVVRELEPEPYFALIDTDLVVEVLPSESTEAELRAQAERQEHEEAAKREAEKRERARIENALAKAAELGPEPAEGPDVVQLRIRLPSGAQLARRFARGAQLRECFTWVESEPSTHVRPGEFRLVQKWPGHCRELGPDECCETLGKLQFSRQEALFLQHLAQDIVPMDGDSQTEEERGPTETAAASTAARGTLEPIRVGEWANAELRAHEALDARLAGSKPDTPTLALREQVLREVRGTELVGVFERLVALGMPPEQAAATSKKYAPQLQELGDMGFEDWLEASRLLDKYNGRLLRVANILSEGAIADAGASSGPQPSVSSTAPVVTAAPLSTAPSPSPAIDTAAVHAKFHELVAAGVPHTDAATQAIQHVRQSMAAAAAAPTDSHLVEMSQDGTQPVTNAEDDMAKLQELIAMGFTDSTKNRELLRKYAGRMERVIEALCAA
mmetsp:Transcript_99868/g.286936  ORF Transcript_99868/g.286936 Transcript_99868/m.286936 type:complete len:684 (+) Transcript_99868:78-2129(+)|eukprot:CAMPEP_0170210398 /NCGR_PEP_ID=MMETSP0116_2-20130129/4805_1 /TAXON_ID=400756 /ORGANISM="Durinskia baltica, Strain CSIRO CS-38" /LENGTH=683 /DNA_ID=CAMNT_0010460913 /DNA_START=78 /DNA_END=2129 /DNA_ORIENTATION=-